MCIIKDFLIKDFQEKGMRPRYWDKGNHERIYFSDIYKLFPKLTKQRSGFSRDPAELNDEIRGLECGGLTYTDQNTCEILNVIENSTTWYDLVEKKAKCEMVTYGYKLIDFTLKQIELLLVSKIEQTIREI